MLKIETPIKSSDRMDRVYKLVSKSTHKFLPYEPLVKDDTLSSAIPLEFSKDRNRDQVIKELGAIQVKK